MLERREVRAGKDMERKKASNRHLLARKAEVRISQNRKRNRASKGDLLARSE